MSIGTRINEVVKLYCNGNNSMFARELGTSEGSVRNYISTGSIKSDILAKIVKTYDINPIWLLLGEGEMLRSPSQPPLQEAKTEIIPCPSPQQGIPLIPIEAWAGVLNGEDYSIMADDCERYIVPSFKDADFLITVRGDSMTPKYYSGDIVACRKVFLSDLWFQWGKVYIIDTNQGSLLKKVRRGSSEETITLVSENPEYEPFELRKDQIYNIAIVQGVIRAE